MSELSIHTPVCPESEQLEAYARRELPSADAEAVEEHFMGCETCWRHVRQALEIRAAFEGEAIPPQARETRSRGWPRGTLAAAAVLVVILGGTWLWQVVGPGGPTAPPLRGGGEQPVLEISVERSGDGIEVSWQRVPGARAYRVELAGKGNVPLRVRETEGLALHLGPLDPAATRVRVLALDELRQELASSPWTPFSVGGSGDSARGGPES